MRKRRKLEREIRLLQKEGKKPKPVDELMVDEKTASIVDQIRRVGISVSEETIDERAVIKKAYCKSRNLLVAADDRWIRTMIREQTQALNVLKEVSPKLYEAAVAPDPSYLPLVMRGPVLTPPLKDYSSPDGDYTDTTPTFVDPKAAALL
ncbi:39S ribosomal protein L40, mitochondrial [Aphelenchoides fujianensis]|nr:39S ribosomal protein L40, mitochondrial [Aphelenchoides fujianensis]